MDDEKIVEFIKIIEPFDVKWKTVSLYYLLLLRGLNFRKKHFRKNVP